MHLFPTNFLRAVVYSVIILYSHTYEPLMASRRQRIPPEEWERHKQTITRLYSEKPLKDVIVEMERNYGFVARQVVLSLLSYDSLC